MQTEDAERGRGHAGWAWGPGGGWGLWDMSIDG